MAFYRLNICNLSDVWKMVLQVWHLFAFQVANMGRSQVPDMVPQYAQIIIPEHRDRKSLAQWNVAPQVLPLPPEKREVT